MRGQVAGELRWLALAALAACTSAPAAPAPKAVACGPAGATCDARTHYCQVVKTDVPALPSTYSCEPLPSSCTASTTDCSCFAAGTRCDYCVRLAAGFQRTCVGGR